MAKHFFKILTIFSAIIVLGLIGVFTLDYFDQGKTTKEINNKTQLAK